MAAKNALMYPVRLLFDRKFNPVYKEQLARYIVPLCEDNSSVLDVGCDDGTVGEIIMQLNPTLKIVGIDIQANRPSKIPRKIYDGKRIPYPDNSFDIVIVLDVLHHTSDILSLLKEIKRVSRKHIIIKDHMTYGTFSNYLISFADYVSNAPYGIKCAFNFPTFERWGSYFNELGLKIIERPRNLSFGFGINERYHPIFKLEKMN
jgi:SAM-dependent methyltransferase